MEELYLQWPDRTRLQINSWDKVRVEVKPRSIVFCGMGGSGVIGDYVYMLSYTVKDYPPVIVVKDYLLPEFINSNDLVFIVSYSGNTLETLSCFYKALAKTRNIVVIASNGRLIEEAEDKGIPYKTIPLNLMPRTALPDMLYAVLGVLDSSGLSLVSLEDAVKALEFLASNTKQAVEEAKIIAEHLYDRIPVVVTTSRFYGLGFRAKNEFNENSKVPVKVEILPEWGHNDIVGWEYNGRYPWSILTIHGVNDSVSELLMEFTENYYKQIGLPVKPLILSGNNMLEKLLYGSLVVGLASVYLARMYKRNPAETKSIVQYKNMLHKISHELIKPR